MTMRTEEDSMGGVAVPEDAYYGPQTQRAVENSFHSGLQLQPAFLHALAMIKRCAADVNEKLGLLETKVSAVIMLAAEEVMAGRRNDQFVVDLFQTGSATSTNMNMNEVLAGRANELLSGKRGGKAPVHPNDHVNLGQSSNDVIPTALHVAATLAVSRSLLPALYHLQQELQGKADQFKEIPKIGRTHLQDAVPITMGQVFSGFSRQIELGAERASAVIPRLTELALGGTAVGNGLNAHPDFAAGTIAALSEMSGIRFMEARNHFEAQSARDAAVELSGALKTVAVSLVKIANDIRLMGSGPRCGLGELELPALQPGSSIMPGKVNPVIAEIVIQAAYQVIGNDTAVTLGGQGGYFELNTNLPLIAYNLLQSLEVLSAAARLLADKCVRDVNVNVAKCTGYIEQSLALVTGLVPLIGYDRAAALAEQAYISGKTIRQTARELNIASDEVLTEILGRDRNK